MHPMTTPVASSVSASSNVWMSYSIMKLKRGRRGGHKYFGSAQVPKGKHDHPRRQQRERAQQCVDVVLHHETEEGEEEWEAQVFWKCSSAEGEA